MSRKYGTGAWSSTRSVRLSSALTPTRESYFANVRSHNSSADVSLGSNRANSFTRQS